MLRRSGSPIPTSPSFSWTFDKQSGTAQRVPERATSCSVGRGAARRLQVTQLGEEAINHTAAAAENAVSSGTRQRGTIHAEWAITLVPSVGMYIRSPRTGPRPPVVPDTLFSYIA